MSILDLWLPILVSAIVMWIASTLIWTVMPWHKKDYSKAKDEEGVRSALRGAAKGFYSVPHCADQAEYKTPEMEKKLAEGPVAFITVLPDGSPSMAKNIVFTFVFFVFIAILCAYFVSRTVAPGTDYLGVFRVAGCVAWIANGVAHIPESIWFGRPWSSTVKSLTDALIYGLLAGGVFGWLV